MHTICGGSFKGAYEVLSRRWDLARAMPRARFPGVRLRALAFEVPASVIRGEWLRARLTGDGLESASSVSDRDTTIPALVTAGFNLVETEADRPFADSAREPPQRSAERPVRVEPCDFEAASLGTRVELTLLRMETAYPRSTGISFPLPTGGAFFVLD